MYVLARLVHVCIEQDDISIHRLVGSVKDTLHAASRKDFDIWQMSATAAGGEAVA
mgnify:CR=1 FL=1